VLSAVLLLTAGGLAFSFLGPRPSNDRDWTAGARALQHLDQHLHDEHRPPFPEAKRRFRIDDDALRAAGREDFSRRIRQARE